MILTIGEYKLRVAQHVLNVFVQLHGQLKYLLSENKKHGCFYKIDKWKR